MVDLGLDAQYPHPLGMSFQDRARARLAKMEDLQGFTSMPSANSSWLPSPDSPGEALVWTRLLRSATLSP